MSQSPVRRLPAPKTEARFVAVDTDGIRVKEDWIGVPLELESSQSVLAGFRADMVGPLRAALLAGIDEANDMRLAKGRAPVTSYVRGTLMPLVGLRLVLGMTLESTLLELRMPDGSEASYIVSHELVRNLHAACGELLATVELQQPM